MFIKPSPIVFLALVLFAPPGEVIGQVPQKAAKPTKMDPIPGITRMNPYYLGISAAVLANDTKALRGYVEDLEKVAAFHPESWMDAMCARLYVLEKLDDRDRFSKAIAQLCARKLADERTARRRLKYVTTTLLTLRMNHKTEWIERASDAIWPVLGSEPDPLLAHILRYRLERMPRYSEKAALFDEILPKASNFLKKSSRAVFYCIA